MHSESIDKVKVIPVTAAEISAFKNTLARLIAAGGSVAELRALITLHDSLQLRETAFDEALKASEEAAEAAVIQAQQDGKEHPGWYGDFARQDALGKVVLGWRNSEILTELGHRSTIGS